MVQITVDTSRDSKEEIKRAIKFLQESIGFEEKSNSITNEEVNDMFSMFGNESSNNSEEKIEPTESDSVIEIIEY